MELIINTSALTLDNLGESLGRSLTAEQVGQLMGFPAVAERIIAIGLSNILKDSHAGVTYKSFKTAAEGLTAKKAKIESTLAALMKGEVRVAREGAAKVPQSVNVARKLVLAMLKPAQRKTIAAMEDDARAAKLDELAAKHITTAMIDAEMVRLETEAKAKAALLATLPTIDLDL
jgi:hypothetical protein